MRYCPHCHRLNPGRPAICHYCGRTWYVKLCPRGHENPPNAQHCGTCGSMDLTETAGPRPWGLYGLKILIALILFVVFFFSTKLIFQSISEDTAVIFLSQIMVTIFLLVGYLIGISILPQSVQGIFKKANRSLLKGALRLMMMFLQKLKEFFNLLLNW